MLVPSKGRDTLFINPKVDLKQQQNHQHRLAKGSWENKLLGTKEISKVKTQEEVQEEVGAVEQDRFVAN